MRYQIACDKMRKNKGIEKMKKTKIIFGMISIILGILLVGGILYLVKEPESKIPEEIRKNVNISEKEFLGRKVFILKPKEGKTIDTKILYFHGGSYIAETSPKHWEFISKIVNETKATLILPDYPLAPKYHYQDVFEMVVPLYKEIIDQVEGKN